jgi:two-component system, cell cycle sensor histidine kinase and response regulator CckA
VPGQAIAGETILVVEDDAGVRHMMTRALEDAGYRVVQADGATEAIEVVAHTPEKIDLLLTDIVMPGQSGRELAEHMQELRPGTPVLFTSGYTDGEIERRGLLRPGAAFIQKPFTPSTLARAVRKTLAAASPRPAGSGGAA